jgi:hypothetical protein
LIDQEIGFIQHFNITIFIFYTRWSTKGSSSVPITSLTVISIEAREGQE